MNMKIKKTNAEDKQKNPRQGEEKDKLAMRLIKRVTMQQKVGNVR